MSFEFGSVVDARLYIAGIAEPIPVSSATATYALDSIPTATINVPLGLPLTNLLNDLPSVSPEVIFHTNLVNRRCLLTVTISRDFGSYILPAEYGTFVMFNGFISSTRFDKTGNSTSLTLEAVHWLSILDYGSAISPQLHPINPKNSFFNIRLALGGAGSPFGYAPGSFIEAIAHPDYVISDFWKFGILAMLQAFLDGLSAYTTEYATEYALVRTTLNSFHPVLSRLTIRREIAPILPKLLESLYGLTDRKPILTLIDNLASNTLWDKLVELARSYLFNIIPYPGFYVVAPVLNGIAAANVAIPPHKILSIDFSKERPTVPIKEVIVYGGQVPLAGSALENTEEAVYPYILGSYRSSVDSGVIRFITCPSYLYGFYSVLSLLKPAIGGIESPIPTARRPRARAQKQIDQFVQYIQRALDLYAKYNFVDSWLLNRSASITVPFRGDIPPGATICAYTSSEAYGNVPVTGTVRSVTYSISSSDAPKTIYSLRAVRTGIENYMPDLNMTEHPLYLVPFNSPMALKLPHLPKA